MKTIQCAHPPHHRNGFVAIWRLRHWPSTAGMSPQSHCGDEEVGRIALSSYSNSIRIKNNKTFPKTESEAIPSRPATSSPRKYRILPRNDTIFYSQNSKNLQDASAENRGVTKFELKEVIHLIQNTMLTLTAFENRFSEQ